MIDYSIYKDFSKKEFEDALDTLDSEYYNNGQSSLPDASYDLLKDYYNATFGKRDKVGAPVKVDNTLTLKHPYPQLLGTLDKIKTFDEFKDWVISKNIKLENLGISFKADGHSLCGCYKNGKMVSMSTRGDDTLGKDLTSYFNQAVLFSNQNVLDFSSHSKLKGKNFGISYEAVITKSNFQELLKEANYSNARNCLNGVMSTDGIKYSRFLTLIPLKVYIEDEDISRIDEVNIINDISISDELSFSYMMHMSNDINDIKESYEAVIEIRDSIEFDIDGLVIESIDTNDRERLGITKRIPNYAIAFKLPPITRVTKLNDIQFFTEGNTATYTPVVYFDPLNIDGKEYTKVSIANIARFNELKLTKDSILTFSLANDILGYVDLLTRNNNGHEFKAPTHCRECNNLLETDNVFLYCTNKLCKLTLRGNLVNFFDKLKIKGISNNIVNSLIDGDVLHDLNDIIDLVDGKLTNKIQSLPGFRTTSADNIVGVVRERLNNDFYDYQLLGSLNIEGYSISRCKLLFEKYTLHELVDIQPDDVKVVGIKDSIHTFYKGLSDNIEVIANFIERFKVIDYKSTVSNVTINHTVVITGTINEFTNRNAFKDYLVLKGVKVVDKVTSKVDYLINNDMTSTTGKNKDAMALGTKIISEKEALELFK